MKIRHKKSLPVSLKGTHNLQRSSCQNEKIFCSLFALIQRMYTCIRKGEQISSLTMVPIKNKNKRFWRKKSSNTFITVKFKELKDVKFKL